MASITISAPRAARASSAGIGVVADTKSFAELGRRLRAAAPMAYKAAQATIRAEAKKVMTDAASNASYSSRIPSSGRVNMSGLNARIRFGGSNAPDAAPIENQGKGFVRHPVFGNREVWTAKNSHPAFLNPALDKHREEIVEILARTTTEAVARAISGRI